MIPAPFILLFVFLGIPAPIFGVKFLLDRRYRAKKQAVASNEFPAGWDAILTRNVPLASKLPAPYAQRLRSNTKRFLAEVGFKGQGIEITDEIRVTVATEAFFEKPKQLHRKRPELYKILINDYRLDPLAWRPPTP